MAEVPNSYKDPYWSNLAANTEEKLGLPAGLLASIVTKGEKTNADQVSSAGAKTPFQIIPSTRKAILDKYGIDPYLSPENAAEGAGLLLKESLDRNKGDTSLAVAEYHGGTNRDNWGAKTKAYVQRVLEGHDSVQTDALSKDFAEFMAKNPAIPEAKAEEQKPQVQEPQSDKLSADFGAFLQKQKEPTLEQKQHAAIAQIPNDFGPQEGIAPTGIREPSLSERLIGAGEAALSTGTGLTGGALGMVGGTAKGIAESILDGTFGTREAANLVEQQAMQGAGALTYQPRTQTGQEYTQTVGEGLQQLIPIGPLAGEMAALSQAGRLAAPVIAGEARQAGAAIGHAAKRIPGAAQDMIRREPAQVHPIAPSVAPVEILRDPIVRARPSEIVIDATGIGKRDQVLDAIGIPRDQRRLGAQTGNRQQIQNEVMIGKLEGAEKMRDQFNMEAQKLGDYAISIQRDTGGTVGASPLQRGEAISAPLEGYQNWYKQQIKSLYDAADESAAASGIEINLNKLNAILHTSSEFAGKAENAAIRRGLRAYLKEQGMIDAEGNLIGTSAKAAEQVKQYLNSQWSPQNKGLIGKLKGAIDDDVLSTLPEDIYGNARAMRRQYAEIFEDPKGIAQILDIAGPDGINRAISLDVLPDTLANWAARNSAQFRHVVKTLENLPTEELQNAGKQAVNEIRSHVVEKIIGKNVDTNEAALGNPVQWKGTDDTLGRLMAPYRGKLSDIIGEDVANKLETLKIGARILRPYDPNPSGTATAGINLKTGGFAEKALKGAGAAIGGITSGPTGAYVGSEAAGKIAGRVTAVRNQNAINQAIARSLDSVEKQKNLKKLSKKTPNKGKL